MEFGAAPNKGRIMSYPSRSAVYFVGVAALLLAGCGGEAALDREADATLAQFHTTCLKRRLPIDTPEHSECVTALYQERQNQLARLRTVIAPVSSNTTNDVEVTSDGIMTNKASTTAPGVAPAPAKSYETDDKLLRGY